jgi:nucleoside-diphosphate-sugar epimerase/SAM-dependent methyltransferase
MMHMECFLCHRPNLAPFLHLGMQPLANKYPTFETLGQEQQHPMRVMFCDGCKNVQLDTVISRDEMFVDYYYLSSVNLALVRHFERLAETLKHARFVVDIGSNDGILLKPLKALGVKCLGIEPSENVSKIARDAGLPTLVDFFNATCVAEIVKNHERPDVVVASSIFTHLEDPHDFLENIEKVLADDGKCIIEVEYIASIIASGQFERFYFDRVFYYSVTSLRDLCALHGLRLVDISLIEPHGGSLRATLMKANATCPTPSANVTAFLEKEVTSLTTDALATFARHATLNAQALRQLLGDLKAQGVRVAGYGSPARVATITNFANIGPDLIEFLVDDSPLKHHRLSPGKHIPIVPKSTLDRAATDALVVFAWEYFADIQKKTEGKYRYFFPIPAKEIVTPQDPGRDIVQEDIRTITSLLGDVTKRFEGKTILISGGSGFLGKYLVTLFCHLNDTQFKTPCKVISVDNYISGAAHPHFSTYTRPDVLQVWADVSQPLPVREDIHFILHAAGLASPVYYKKFPLETIESCISGAKNLLELAKRNKNLEGFLFFSSSEIYGNPDPAAIPTPETYHGYVSSVGPRACYDESKRLGETITTIYHEQFNIPATIVRPFNVFGPGMGHADKRVLPAFAYSVLNDEPLAVHGSGNQTRTFCYITDAINGFLRILTLGKHGETYNIGNSDNEIAMKDLAALVIKAHDPKSAFACVPYPEHYPAGEPERRCPDITKAKADLAFVPTVSLEQGLQRFLDWCKNEESYKAQK